MKKCSILLMLLTAFLVSCQIRAESISTILNINSIKKTIIAEEAKSVTSLTPAQKLKFDIHSKIGIVEVDSEGVTCLRTKNGKLAAKTPVSIIISLSELPQKILTATVGKKLDKSCTRPDSETGDKNPGENFFYSLNLTETTNEDTYYDLGIAVIEPTNPIQIQNKLANIDLDEDGKPEFFRLCQGFEGFYFTIWTGKPLKGKRIWDSFFYVDYDTVPTCKKKDREDTDD